MVYVQYSAEQLETLNSIDYQDSLKAGLALGIHRKSDEGFFSRLNKNKHKHKTTRYFHPAPAILLLQAFITVCFTLLYDSTLKI